MDSFVLSVLEGRYLVSFVGYFDGTVYYIGGPCVCIVVGGVVTASEIDAMKLNDSSPVSCKAEM